MSVNKEEGGWRALVRRSPNWLIVVAIAVVYTALILGMDFLKGEEIEPEKAALTAVLGLGLGCFAIWINRWKQARDRRQPQGAPTATNVQQAISSGQLPEHATAEEWLPELQKIVRQERHWAWGGPLFFGLFTAMGIFLIFDDPAHPWFGVFVSACFLGAAVWYPIWVRRRRARINGLIADLVNKPPEPAT
ncbi:hypothetical protein [Arthrobacter sp. NPDC093139]|uniref:hypothetical protein n=1 Tax=Arthrobacter sp. NPDC093139 TaxID=3363945 RepID=UPI00382DDD4D